MADFGFVGQAYEAASYTQDTQRLINWYPETDPTKFAGSASTGILAARGVTALYPTPGLVKKVQLAVGMVRGFRTLPGNMTFLAVSGSTLYSINTSYTATTIGNLSTTNGSQVYITDNGVAAYITDGTYRYFYQFGPTVAAASITGYINGTALTVTAVASGTLDVGQTVSGAGVSANTIITSLNTSAAFTASITTTVLTVTAVSSGTLAVGQFITGAGVTPGTNIVSLGSGAGNTGTYNLNNSLSIGSESMTSSASASGSTGSYTVGVSQTVVSEAMTTSNVQGTFSAIADGPFTGGGMCDEVDNFMIYTNPNTNQWGCTNVGAVSSNALNLGSVIGAVGNLQGLIVDHRQVLLLGERYSERWVDVGSFPFPFSVIAGSSMQHGLGAPNSISRLGEGVAFLSTDTRGNSTVVIWGATLSSPTRISTFAIENAIQSYAVTNDAIGMTYTMSGHEFYFLTFPTQDVTWVYDLASNMWHQRAYRDTNGAYHRHRANCMAEFNGDVIVGDFSNGKVYIFSQTVYTDDGDLIPCVRRCQHLTTDLKRQFFHDLQIQFQPGVGLNSGQGSDPSCIVRWSDDGGFTFGNDHIVKLGKMGKYRHRAKLRRMGWGRDRVYEVEMTDPVYRVVNSANLEFSSGAS